MSEVHGEERVNTHVASNQENPHIAVLADGSYVIVWTSYDQDASNSYGTYAQRFSAKGVPIGPEWRVNTSTADQQVDAKVAALSNGGFVVVWTDQSGIDDSSYGVYAQRYDASGNPAGAQSLVNTTTSSVQHQPSVAGYGGGYIVSWTSNGNAGGNGYDIYTQRFNNDGTANGGEVRVNTTTLGSTQEMSQVAARADGSYVVVWVDQSGADGNSYGVYAQRYNSAGVGAGEFRVNTFTTGAQYEAQLAMLSDGGFVVVWRSDNQDGSSAGVYAQRYDASGVAQGSEFRINESTVGGQYQPAVTGLSSGGFVVTWYNDNYDVGGTGTTVDVYIREYDAAGNAIDGQRKLASPSNSTESQPAIADLGSGNFVVAYTDYNNAAGGNNTNEIVQQLFGDAGELGRSNANPVLGDFTGTVTFAENLVNATPQIIDAAVSLSDVDSANFGGGRLDLFYTISGEATDQLGVRNQGSGAGQIGVVPNGGSFDITYGGTVIGSIAAGPNNGANGANLRIDLNASASIDAVEALIQNLSYASSSQSPLASRTVAIRVSDGDGGSSVATEVVINVTGDLDGAPLVWGEERVNTHVASTQDNPHIAVLADGSYVTVWTSYSQDETNSYGTYAQRFSAKGVPIGPEWRVNSSTDGQQVESKIAALGNGGFVVVWTDQNGLDGSGYGVVAQRYDAAGNPAGGQSLVNTFTSSHQSQPSVAGYTNGYVVAWTSSGNAGGSSNDIYTQRFNNAGTKVGGEVRVNTNLAGQQQEPQIAARADGSAVVVWVDYNNADGNSYGVYAQRYASNGAAAGSEFRVNTFTTGAQYEAQLAMLSDGGFVVVWRSDNQDGSSAGVYAQRYDASGVAQGSEFRINESTVGGQYQPAVTGLSSGGFVVTWYNDNYDVGGAGTTSDVYIREYDAAGNAIDGQRKLASPSNSTESQPAIADLGSGNFVVAYTDYNNAAGGNNTNEIVQQLFGDAGELARPSANPVLGDFTGTVTFAENLVNATPQIIDAAVSLSDIDSANFGGGRLDLFYTISGEASDQLGVRNQGSSAGQIGVVPNGGSFDITYGGTVIGSIAAGPNNGANGANLRIDLNASASIDAVEALIQNLSYASTSQSPLASRTVAIRVSDGDGGSSVATEVVINVEGQVDGAPVVWGEERVNTHVASNQEAPHIAVLADGSYVTVWTSYDQDANSTWGTYAQRFSAKGVPIGPEFRVNTSTAGGQVESDVAALGSGGFVVVWTDQSGIDGSGYGVYAQRYDAAGNPAGTQSLVNTFTSSHQSQPSVAGYTSGYVVTWTSSGNAGGSSEDIYTQRFNNDGTPNGGEVRVNTTVSSTQKEPQVAARADGSYVVVWVDYNNADGSSYGVYAQRYASNGAAAGSEFRVNTFTTGAQYEAQLAMLSDGGFVVVWRSDNQDGSSAGVYAQRYDASGVAQGGEFRINESTVGGQYQPAVTGLSSGGFVVTWYNDNYDVGGAGTTSDVYIREYDAAGNAIDGQRRLASPSNSTEYQPAIADLGSGNFVVAYTDYNNAANGSNTYDIVQQLFGDAGELARPSANPVLGDVRTLLTLTSAALDPNYAGTARPIDNDVFVADADSANFDGGQLIVTLLNGATASEALAVRNQGTTATLIGVSGADVTYGGVTIGSFVGGGAGATVLTITLNTNANAAAVRALVENITYQNTSPPAGTTDRYVAFRLSDGDGGVSDDSTAQVRIQASYAPPVHNLADVEDARSISEAQANAGVLVDDAVQLDYTGATGYSNGKLLVSYVSATGRPADQLSIRNQAGGAGEVSVSGSSVSYEGSQIGSVSLTLNGVNGANLEITFNASASAQAIERVIENLVYANNSAGPNPQRTIRINVTDGNNVSSGIQDVDINIAAQADPAAAVPLFGEQQSNTFEAGQQQNPAVGRLFGANNGGYVITWVSQGAQDGEGYGVFAQRYAANGSAQGPEFQVNSGTLGNQYEPAVAGLADGSFVIVWRNDNGQDGSSYGVFAQRYAADGTPAGAEFQVNTSFLSSQYQPAVVGLSGGGFIVAFYSDYTNASSSYSYDVLAQRYAADGSPLGAEFTLNTLVSSTQSQPQLAALSTGGFVSIWTDTGGADGAGYGVYARRFAADGTPAGGDIPVNTTTAGNQYGADVAALPGGAFVAAWYDASHIYAQMFDANGDKVGVQIQASTQDSTAYSDYARVVALESGGFVVVWDSSYALGGNAYEVVAQQFSAAGAKVDGVVRINSTIASWQYQPDVVALTGSNYVAAWAGYDQERIEANSYGVFHQIMGASGSLTRSAAPVISDLNPSVSFAENLVNATPQLIDANVAVDDSDSANFDGGRLWVSVITGYGDIVYAQLPDDPRAQDQLGIRNEGSNAGQIGVSGSAAGSTVTYGGTLIGTIVTSGANGGDLVVQFNANASAAAVEALIQNLSYANTSSAPVASRTISVSVSDGDGATSEPRMVTINVTPDYDGAQPLFGNDKVNTYEPNTQDAPAIARLADGGYVIVWQTNDTQDGWLSSVHGQRYDAKGVAVGSEFQVNSFTPFQQQQPSVAGLSGGGHVVLWQSNLQDGGGWGIFGQRFDANGVKAGSEFLVNAGSVYDQTEVSVAAVAGGGFVATWISYYQNGSYYDIYAQRFDGSGAKLGTEFQVNSAGNFYHYTPEVASFADGSFVVVFRSDGQDGSSAGIYAQRYAANGNPAGLEFRVNTYTTGDQFDPSVAVLADGKFVVVWTSTNQDGSSYGVFGQRYNANGSALGDEFRISTVTSGNQYEASVSALSHGGFAVAYNDSSRSYVQQFDASGRQLDHATRIDTIDANNNASNPFVLGLDNGGLVVAWQDYDYSTNTYNIYQQVMGQPADFVRQANPQLVDVTTSVTFAENAINAVPGIIDPGVGLIDTDSANFDGGLLEVNYLTGYGGQDQFGLQSLTQQDQLGIRHQGNAFGQIGVASGKVYYGGTEIGSIVSNGANGAKLAVQFNANATVDAVEHLIENLTYANTVSNPIASRTVSIRVSDGDGGSSVARSVTINVTPQTDGAVKMGLEGIVNTDVDSTQQQPAIARLSDGGYVVVWESYDQDAANTWGVYGQRYDLNDNKVGAEFRVNTAVGNSQYEPQVAALKGAGGGFVVVWRSDNQDGNSAGVYAQRYASDGSAAGVEFLVNTRTTSGEYQPTVTGTADGGFVVAWYHDYYNTPAFTELHDVYFQRYNAGGVAQGAETQATPTAGTSSTEYQPSITALTGGGFVVVWTNTSGADGNSYGVFGQRFDAGGVKQGSVFQANSYSTSTQDHPSVAALKDGGFIVVWDSEGQDFSSTGVYAQRFDAAAGKLGAEFRVNSTINSTQNDGQVVGLENGGWVVTWYDANSGDVKAQQYNAAGQPVDHETTVNSYGYSTQYQPAITSMADGGFVVAYSGYIYSGDADGDGAPDGGNNTQEIRIQRFSNTAPNLSDVVVNGAEEAVIPLTAALFESGFNDPEGQALQAIKVITLPASGTLRLNGNAVLPDQEISIADLQAGLLTYKGNLDFFGLDQFRWTGSDGVAFAPTPVFTNITLSNVNDGPRLEAGANDSASEGTFFNHGIVLNDPDPEGHQITVQWGDGQQTVFNVGNTPNQNIWHYYADNGVYNVSVSANDQQGQPNSIETDGFQVTVANVAPTLSLFGNASVEQAQSYTLDLGTVVDPGADTVTEYRIDWGDGSALQVIPTASLPANRELTHVFATPGTPTISVALVDEDGTWANAGSKSITVSAPAETIVVDAGSDIAVNEGAFFSRNISFTDPTDQGAAGRSYSVNWGDGQTSSGNIAAGQFTFNIGHTYADGAANYNVTVSVDDVLPQSGSDSFGVSVNNIAPTLSLGGAGSVNEGSSFTLPISSNDPGSDTISQYVIHWGDGNQTTLSAADLLALGGNVPHTYADGNQTLNITVDVTDEDGSYTAAGSRSLFVANVAPTAPVSGANAVDEGSAYTLSVGAVVDPGADARTSYSIAWGDGATDTFTPTQWAAANGSFSHTYADGANGGTARTIVVSATDEDGTFTLGSKTLTVNNVAPSQPGLSGNANSNEGALYTLAITPSTDPAGANDALSYTIAWGDGSANTVLTAAQLQAQGHNVTHTYADDEDGAVNSTARSISVSVNDGDGGTSQQTKQVNVDNVAPSVALGGAAGVQAGVSYTLNVGAITDPGVDTVSQYLIRWGDGTQTALSATDLANQGGNVTHTYAAAGNFNIGVDLTDEDGSFSDAGIKAVVVSAASATVNVDAGADTAVNEGASFTRTVSFTDGQDNGAAGWSYVINWGDGTADTSGSTATQTVDLNHVFADGASTSTVTVTVTDEAGESDSDSFDVSVANVAPTAPVSGANTADEGSAYVLSVGAVVEPGADARTSYSIAWGDGATDTFTPSQWTAANGSFSHTYADGANGGTARTIVVSTTDEDGTFTLGSKTLTVNNVAPSQPGLSGNANSNEGALYTLAITPSTDPAGANDALSYTIAWGDGSANTVLTAAQLQAQGHNVTHTYADDEDGAVNSTARSISVSVNDGDGGTSQQTKQVSVDNVAPTVALGGAAGVQAGVSYTLNVGAITDPGVDTVSQYVIRWGDGSADTVLSAAQLNALSGNVTHTYAAAGNFNIGVDLTDEDGSFSDAGAKAVVVSAASPTVNVDAGADTAVNEGASFTRTISFTDGQDNGAAGWSYVINWGDGSADTTGTTATQTVDLNHVFADGASTSTVTVTVTDEAGETDSDSFDVSVANVAPAAPVSGANAVDEGSAYALSVGTVVDPGADARTSYSIAWGDGATDTFTPTQWAAANGSFSHTYADGANGGTARTIVVSATDEDGTFTLGSKTLTVNNVAPSQPGLSGNANSNEGALYTLAITPSTDPAGANDALTYTIAWGDGSADTVLSAADLANAGGNVTHTYLDDADGAVNSSARNIVVTVDDGDGGTSQQTTQVNVDNVAPSVALGGAGGVQAGVSYTLNVGAITDPGDDTVSQYVIRWGDGTQTALSATDLANQGGNVTHTYAAAGSFNIGVDLSDEDGSFSDAGSQAVVVSAVTPPNEIVRIGDAPQRLTSATLNAWTEAWTDRAVASITHKADLANAGEAWSAVSFTNANQTVLTGGDVYLGDLGVSGRTLATSVVRPEIDGSEGLRFETVRDAVRATLEMSRFFGNDEGTGFAESARVQAFDVAGNLVGEQVYTANTGSGEQAVTFALSSGFRSLVVSAGDYNGASFVYGGYSNADGSFGAAPGTINGALRGSDLLVDAVEFELPVAPLVPLVGIDATPTDPLIV